MLPPNPTNPTTPLSLSLFVCLGLPVMHRYDLVQAAGKQDIGLLRGDFPPVDEAAPEDL